jgi:hypothetical protein
MDVKNDSKATSLTPLLDLAFENYSQSNGGINLSRLHIWMPNANWNRMDKNLYLCEVFKWFLGSGDVFEVCNHKQPALEKGALQSSTSMPMGQAIIVGESDEIPVGPEMIWLNC